MTAIDRAGERPVLFEDVRLGLSGPHADVLVADGRVQVCSARGGLEVPTGGQRVPGRGGTLLPGMRDRHVHVEQWAIALRRVDLTATASANDALETMATFLGEDADLTSEDLVIGYGFRDAMWPDIPHKDLLERRFPGRPIAMVSNDLHTIWASPAALAALEIEHENGILREEEAFSLSPRLNGASTAQVDEWVLQSLQRLPELGITNVMDFEVGNTVASWRRRREAHGPLPVRIDCSVWPPYVEEVLAARLRTGSPIAADVPEVGVGWAKVMLDGSLNTRTAYCHDPYPGTSAGSGQERGLLLEDPAELTSRMRAAAPHGLDYAVHAIGDAANTVALDCFEAAGSHGRIEHAQFLDAADIARFGELGITASIQPSHAAEDRDIADHIWRGRTDRAYPYSAIATSGGTLEFGSDAPVSNLDPWYVIAASMRRTIDERPPWHPEHALTLTQAIAASTGGKITVQVGDVADLVLVAADPSELGAVDLGQTRVLTTVMDGRVTYEVE